MFNINIDQQFVKQTMLPFIKSATVITLVEILNSRTRGMSLLSQRHMTFFRRFLSYYTSPLSNMYFSTSSFNEKNFPYSIICIKSLGLFTKHLSFLRIRFQDQMRFLKPLEKIKELIFYRKIKSFFMIQRNDKLGEIYNSAIVTPIFEEFFYRLILQEGLLRQAPKLLASRFSIPISVDHPIFRATRVVIAAFIFAISHENPKFSQTFLGGLALGYEKEYLGIGASILSHYSNNLYIALGSK